MDRKVNTGNLGFFLTFILYFQVMQSYNSSEMKVLDFTTLSSFLNHREKLNPPFRFHSSKPDILFVTDMEGTVIPLDSEKKVALMGDSLSKNIRVVQGLNERALKVLSTGSDLKRVASFEDILESMWYDLVFISNGKELYVGDDLLGEKKVSNIEANSSWKTLVEEYAGWKVNDLVSITKSQLHELGFSEIDHHYKTTYKNNIFMGNKNGLELAINPTNGSLFTMKIPKLQDSELAEFTKTVSSRIVDLYFERTGKKLQYQISEFSGYFNVFFETAEIKINKLTSTEAIPELFKAPFLENVKACIVAGDSENDEHLKLEEIRVNGKKVPVFSLHSGKRLKDNSYFNGHKRIFISPEEGNISEKLEEIVRTIDTL